jgi:hypothetical protein
VAPSNLLGLTVLHRDQRDVSSTCQWLLQEHGPLLSASDVAKLLAFRSTDALRQARIHQRLPIEMFRVEGRRGWFAATMVVAAWIEETTQPRSDRKTEVKE